MTSLYAFNAGGVASAVKPRPRFGADETKKPEGTAPATQQPEAQQPAAKPAEQAQPEAQPYKATGIDRLPRLLQPVAAAGLLVGYLVKNAATNASAKYKRSQAAPGRPVEFSFSPISRSKNGEFFVTAFERSDASGFGQLKDFYVLDTEGNQELLDILLLQEPGNAYRVKGTVSEEPGFFSSKGRLKVESITLTSTSPANGAPGTIGGSKQIYPKV